MRTQTKCTIDIIKALADENRLTIIKLLSSNKEHTCAMVSEHLSHLSQPTISHHFKVLIDADIVVVNKVGTACHYTLNTDVLQQHGIDVTKILP